MHLSEGKIFFSFQHKKHAKNTKLDQYRSIVKKAIGKPQHFISKQKKLENNEPGLRSLRQSSILNRKAIEGAQKADQLKRKRWEQQRLCSPPKRTLRRTAFKQSIEGEEDLRKKPDGEPKAMKLETEFAEDVEKQTVNSESKPETQKKAPLRSAKRCQVEAKTEIKVHDETVKEVSPSRPMRSVRLSNSRKMDVSSDKQVQPEDMTSTRAAKKRVKTVLAPKAPELATKTPKPHVQVIKKICSGDSDVKQKKQTAIVPAVNVETSARPTRKAKIVGQMKTKDEMENDNFEDNAFIQRKTLRKKDEKNVKVIDFSPETKVASLKSAHKKPLKKGHTKLRLQKSAKVLRSSSKNKAEEPSAKPEEKAVETSSSVAAVETPEQASGQG